MSPATNTRQADAGGLRHRVLTELRAIRERVRALEQLLEQNPQRPNPKSQPPQRRGYQSLAAFVRRCSAKPSRPSTSSWPSTAAGRT